VGSLGFPAAFRAAVRPRQLPLRTPSAAVRRFAAAKLSRPVPPHGRVPLARRRPPAARPSSQPRPAALRSRSGLIGSFAAPCPRSPVQLPPAPSSPPPSRPPSRHAGAATLPASLSVLPPARLPRLQSCPRPHGLPVRRAEASLWHVLELERCNRVRKALFCQVWKRRAGSRALLPPELSLRKAEVLPWVRLEGCCRCLYPGRRQSLELRLWLEEWTEFKAESMGSRRGSRGPGSPSPRTKVSPGTHQAAVSAPARRAARRYRRTAAEAARGRAGGWSPPKHARSTRHC